MTRRQGRRRRKPLDDLKERREYSRLKEETLDRTMRRARFGRGFGQGKAIPLQAWIGPEGSRRLRIPDFKTVGT